MGAGLGLRACGPAWRQPGVTTELSPGIDPPTAGSLGVLQWLMKGILESTFRLSLAHRCTLICWVPGPSASLTVVENGRSTIFPSFRNKESVS